MNINNNNKHSHYTFFPKGMYVARPSDELILSERKSAFANFIGFIKGEQNALSEIEQKFPLFKRKRKAS
jgi:hypothetical protein